MNEVINLKSLREKLVRHRRRIVATLNEVTGEDVTANSVRDLQTTIEAIDRAIADEGHAEMNVAASKQT